MLHNPQDTTGQRLNLRFGLCLGGSSQRRRFAMDAYVFGCEEGKARVRVVAAHGISADASRTRWHRLGERFRVPAKKVRFVALDWSLDRPVRRRRQREREDQRLPFDVPEGCF